jgi:hypothetical protein
MCLALTPSSLFFSFLSLFPAAKIEAYHFEKRGEYRQADIVLGVSMASRYPLLIYSFFSFLFGPLLSDVLHSLALNGMIE